MGRHLRDWGRNGESCFHDGGPQACSTPAACFVLASPEVSCLPSAQADRNCPVEVHLRADPDDARAMTRPAGVAPRGDQPWSSHRRRPLRSGKRRKRKWQRPKEPQSSMGDQSTRFPPAVTQVRRVQNRTRAWQPGLSAALPPTRAAGPGANSPSAFLLESRRGW